MATITDPRAMRALAHPLRIQLLEAVIARGQATATELATALGDTPANCSYHLRKLAEFGYLQRVEGATGREKPWRASDPTQDIEPDPKDREALLASTAVGAAVLEWDTARLRSAQGRQNPPQWRGATFLRGATMIVTPDEAREIGRALNRAVEPFLGRLTDPSQRPPEAGAIRLFAATTFLPEYQQILDEQAASGATGSGDRP